jgi:hypothetical protein
MVRSGIVITRQRPSIGADLPAEDPWVALGTTRMPVQGAVGCSVIWSPQGARITSARFEEACLLRARPGWTKPPYLDARAAVKKGDPMMVLIEGAGVSARTAGEVRCLGEGVRETVNGKSVYAGLFVFPAEASPFLAREVQVLRRLDNGSLHPSATVALVGDPGSSHYVYSVIPRPVAPGQAVRRGMGVPGQQVITGVLDRDMTPPRPQAGPRAERANDQLPF